MASTLTKENAAVTLRALSMGASEALAKPSSATELNAAEDFRLNLIAKTKLLGLHAQKRRLSDKAKTDGAISPVTSPAVASAPQANNAPITPPPAQKSLLSPQTPLTLRPISWTSHADIIAIGSSTGGPQALVEFLGHLKGAITQPVFITQHMPPTFTTILADQITKSTGFDCREGTDHESVKPGRFYIAPGNHHMLIKNIQGTPTIILNQDPPENFCRPAVDPMLRSLGECYGGKKILVIILTGMGADGLKGAEKIAASNHVMILAQDEASSVVWGMPGAVAKAGLCTKIGSLKELADAVRVLAR
jgi:two-component system chemotaxis response regulator CheB